MTFKKLLPALLLGTAALAPPAALGQDAEQPATEQPAEPATDEAAAVTQECREQMVAFTQQMREDQLWIGGWGGWAVGWGAWEGAAPAAPPEGVALDPWAGIGQQGMPSPRGQIGVLYAAAQVFAQQGNQEGCAYVMGELDTLYGDYVAQLQEAGVGPEQVMDWRQEQIALAEPVTEAEWLTRVSADDLIGTDVRTPTDENLGSVNDVVLDPDTGDISYLLVARGGFLGIGEDYVAVPWERVRSTPGLETLVLDVSPQQFETAPQYDPAVTGDDWLTQFGEDLEQFWSDLTS